MNQTTSFLPLSRLMPLLLLLLSPLVAEAASPYEMAFDNAMGSMYAIDYDTASVQFEEAIRLEPANPRAYLYLASTYWMKILRLRNSLQSTAFGLPPDLYAPPNESSIEPGLREKFENTIRQMKEKTDALITSNPKNAEAIFWLGMAEGCESVFIITVDHKIFAAKSHADRSFELMEQAVALDPTFKDPLFAMGMHMHLLGTRGLFTRMVLKLMGYRVSKEEGRKFVEIAASEARYVRDDAKLGLLLCNIREERWHEAVKVTQEILTKFPQDSLIAMSMGRIQASLGEYNGAVKTFENILTRINQNQRGYRTLSSSEINLRLALALLGNGRTQDAQAALERALQDKHITTIVKAAALLTLGQCRDLLKDRPGAIAAYQATLVVTPKTPSHDKARQFLTQPYDGKVPPG